MFNKALLLISCALVAAPFLSNAQTDRESEIRALKKEYANKMKELKEDDNKHYQAPKKDYGNNIIRLAPIKFLDVGGFGFGLEYERILGKDGMFGVTLPYSLQFASANGPSGEQNVVPHHYFNPGLKIYFSGQRRITYSLGPSLMFGFSDYTTWDQIFDPSTGIAYHEQQNIKKFTLGVLVMNYLAINVNENITLGIDLGIGLRYLDQRKVNGFKSYNNHDFLDTPTGQFSFSFGYRF